MADEACAARSIASTLSVRGIIGPVLIYVSLVRGLEADEGLEHAIPLVREGEEAEARGEEIDWLIFRVITDP